MINTNFCLLFEAHGDSADRNDEDEDEIPDKTSKADSVDEWFRKLLQSQILDEGDADYVEDDYFNIDNYNNTYITASSDDINDQQVLRRINVHSIEMTFGSTIITSSGDSPIEVPH
ncbi:hypothetical protein J6590_081626 [Homalodisca vitripennis]|nr:hypothetical protein J6590_081626 [Homalodisca vitripennis]